MEVDADEDVYQRINNLEIEKSFLSRQVKELENALNKQKNFHRKFAADVTEAEEMRIKDFNIETKELREENKRLRAENRELSKQKIFYQAAFNSLSEENDSYNVKERLSNTCQSTLEPIQQPYNTRRSSTDFQPISTLPSHFSINETAVGPSRKKNSLKEVTRQSEKWFQDYKKMKLKLSKISSENSYLKSKVKKLENSKKSEQTKKTSLETQRIELQGLSKTNVRTNEQIFDAKAIAKLRNLLK